MALKFERSEALLLDQRPLSSRLPQIARAVIATVVPLTMLDHQTNDENDFHLNEHGDSIPLLESLTERNDSLQAYLLR